MKFVLVAEFHTSPPIIAVKSTYFLGIDRGLPPWLMGHDFWHQGGANAGGTAGCPMFLLPLAGALKKIDPTDSNLHKDVEDV